MKRRLISVAVLALTAFVSAGIGNRLAWRQCQRILVTQVSGALAIHLEALSSLRIGDPETAVHVLERTIDNEILTLPRDEPIANNSLRAAKLYRSVFPPDDDIAERIEQSLESVPMPEARACSEALQAIWEMNKEGRSGDGGADPASDAAH
jgi:hypothetical protein